MEEKRRKVVSDLPPKYSDDTNIKESPICQLSTACLVHIFQFLPYADRTRVQRVCKPWQEQSKQAWQLQRRLTLRDVDWGYVNNQHLSFLTNEIIVKVLQQCCTKTLTCLDFCISGEDSTCTDFLKRFHLEEPCVKVILTFVNLKAVHLTNIQLERVACKELFELPEVAPVEEFSMGVCPLDLSHEISRRFFSRAKNLKMLGMPLDMVARENVEALMPKMVEVLLYQASYNLDLPDMFFEAHKTVHNLRTISVHLKEKFSARQFQRLLDSISDNVKTIEIVKFFYTYDVLTPVRFFKNINELTRLTKLIVVGLHIKSNDAIFNAIGEHCKELTYIELGGMIKLTDTGIERFADLPKLRELHLFKIRKITDVSLGRMTQLRKLHLFNCPHVQNPGLDNLLIYGNLELFDVEFCIGFCIKKFMRTAMKMKDDLPPGSTILKVIFRKKNLGKEKATRVLPFLHFQKVRAKPRIIQPHHNHEQTTSQPQKES